MIATILLDTILFELWWLLNWHIHKSSALRIPTGHVAVNCVSVSQEAQDVVPNSSCRALEIWRSTAIGPQLWSSWKPQRQPVTEVTVTLYVTWSVSIHMKNIEKLCIPSLKSKTLSWTSLQSVQQHAHISNASQTILVFEEKNDVQPI